MNTTAIEGMYVHVPFCPTICPYCDFHVVLRQKGAVAAYLKRLKQEAAQLPARPLGSVYIGGGTPSFLRDDELEQLGSMLEGFIGPHTEVTLEVNPGTLNKARLKLLHSIGVNRVSVGVQSFDDTVLKTLGRAHGRKGAIKAIVQAQDQGFRVSADMIMGLPEQPLEQDIAMLLELQLQHVSAYTLQIEAGTPFELQGLTADSDQQAQHFDTMQQALASIGLVRYEVSNFAVPGQESRHNLLYWNYGYWYGLGPSAAGRLPHPDGNMRQTNPPLPRWLAQEAPHSETTDTLETLKEALMMGLRTLEGFDTRRIPQMYRETVLQAAQQLVQSQELQWHNQALRATSFNTLHKTILHLWNALE